MKTLHNDPFCDCLWHYRPAMTTSTQHEPTHTGSYIYCTQLYTGVVKGCYQHFRGGLGGGHIILGRLPVFPSLHVFHTLILSSLYCFFSLSLHSSLYVSLSLCSTVSLSLFLSVGRIWGRMGYSKSSQVNAGCKDSSFNQTQRCRNTESRRGKRPGSQSVNQYNQPRTRSHIRINTVATYRWYHTGSGMICLEYGS